MNHRDAITISGLEFYGYHGFSDEEQTLGHRYRVNLRIGVDTRPAGRSDAIGDTVNYADVAQTILEIGTTERFRLLEALAQRLSDALMHRFPRIEWVDLHVEKQLPPMNAIVSAVGIEIYRTRAQQ